MEIHYKSTIWTKIKIDDDNDVQEIIKELEAGCSPLDLQIGNMEFEPILETEEFMFPEENDGQETIEVMVDDENSLGLKSIWNNKTK